MLQYGSVFLPNVIMSFLKNDGLKFTLTAFKPDCTYIRFQLRLGRLPVNLATSAAVALRKVAAEVAALLITESKQSP
eukprot:2388739-Amphidinium_carterae.1